MASVSSISNPTVAGAVASSTANSVPPLPSTAAAAAAAAAATSTSTATPTTQPQQPKRRNPRTKKQPPTTTTDSTLNVHAASFPSTAVTSNAITLAADETIQSATTTATTTTTTTQPLQPTRRNPRKKKQSSTTTTNSVSVTTEQKKTDAATATPSTNSTTALSKNQIRNAKRKTQNRKKKEQQHTEQQTHSWWRTHVPIDSVDPITLESLQSLQYPPFALVASPPYAPINWPPNDGNDKDNNNNKNNSLTEEERQRQILESQWGESLRIEHDGNVYTKRTSQPTSTGSEPPQCQSQNRHVNLFDGRALAYYMVSQLQFIDPLNRRDITRDELIHLDQYLRRNKFFELNVVEAYDTKGVTLSSAGATANTAMGRSMILQQEAQTLLNALFGGNALSRPLPVATVASHQGNRNSFMDQYEANESAYHRRQLFSNASNGRRLNNQMSNTDNQMASNVLNDTGMIIIDDDETPGLRGNASSAPLYSANHIAARYGNNNSSRRPVPDHDFPSLAAVMPLTTTLEQQPAILTSAAPKTLPKTKTLSKIGKMVKETNPEEQQRQWEAREAARRKAMMANLTFGSNPMVPISSSETENLFSTDGIPSQITTVNGPSVTQIERNRAFAEALGVQPATVRSNVVALGGWMRPTERPLEHDEFGNELYYTIYPDSLVKHAKEMRLDIILKLEKKWKLFLNDDRAASLPLYPMEKSNRAFVHEYAEYWKLHTESFDPEPKRYVHCVKLRDTCAPYPLLSDAMKVWQPTNRTMNMNGTMATPMYSNDHSTNQTAGQSTTSSSPDEQQQREFPSDASHQRVPLLLKPRSTIVPSQSGGAMTSVGISISGAPSRRQESDVGDISGRFVSLTDGRERPKLELQKRTLPLELPLYDGNAAAVGAVDLNVVHVQQMERQQRKIEQAQAKAQRKQRALQSAFASDDEKSDDSDSEWDEKVAIYHSSSDDES